ncbi:hypothetical protein [Salmonella phage vB_SenS_SE1]|uniref:Uncharacterized protein n=2 Tax=Cornellvirus TaxID=1910993 RepID=A0A481W727_9CAUD|nr:hypothetical protein PF620_gp45 [Salmonella phage TS6]YP_010582485.1 hypothetical protein PF623_gp53 [Salmonella phage vB_SenS_SE1]AZF89088.1 hypothetical protein AP6_045 [Salmonella phage TS6]QBJ04042.1 hypothetical protein [Salmonella phage vB_SenS_SE1]
MATQYSHFNISGEIVIPLRKQSRNCASIIFLTFGMLSPL